LLGLKTAVILNAYMSDVIPPASTNFPSNAIQRSLKTP
jgi:hypothetical protein